MLFFARSVPLVGRSFSRGYVRAFPKYYYPGVSNYYGFPGFMASKMYSAVASNYREQQQQQRKNTHAIKTIDEIKQDVRVMLSKYTSRLIPTHQKQAQVQAQVQAPSRAQGMTALSKHFKEVSTIDKKPEKGSKASIQFRYFATSVMITLIHYIIRTKEN